MDMSQHEHQQKQRQQDQINTTDTTTTTNRNSQHHNDYHDHHHKEEHKRSSSFWSTQPVPHSTRELQQPSSPHHGDFLILRPHFIPSNISSIGGAISSSSSPSCASTTTTTTTTDQQFIEPILSPKHDQSLLYQQQLPPTPLPASNFYWRTLNLFGNSSSDDQNRSGNFNNDNSGDHDGRDELEQVYQLLKNHYVEDEDEKFRFAYPKEFLRWALETPNYFSEWHIALFDDNIADTSRKMIGFITGTPQNIQFQQLPLQSAENVENVENVENAEQLIYRMANVNFLCLHKEYRNRGLAPLMICELRRQCARFGHYFTAVYTSGTLLPTPPISRAKYYIRDLSVRKLCQIDYSQIPYSVRRMLLEEHQGEFNTVNTEEDKNEKMLQMYESIMQLPRETSKKYVPFDASKHAKSVHRLLDRYLKHFQLSPHFSSGSSSLDEVRHWFTSRPNVIYTFVHERSETCNKGGDSNDGDGDIQVSSVISFFFIPTSIIDSATVGYDSMNTAYNFYTFSESIIQSWEQMMTRTDGHSRVNKSDGGDDDDDRNGDDNNCQQHQSQHDPWIAQRIELVRDTLILARDCGADCFQMLNIQSNVTARLTQELRFNTGFGYLNYYLFGLKCSQLDPSQVGLVML